MLRNVRTLALRFDLTPFGRWVYMSGLLSEYFSALTTQLIDNISEAKFLSSVIFLLIEGFFKIDSELFYQRQRDYELFYHVLYFLRD